MFTLLLLGWFPWLVLAAVVFYLGLRAVRAIERRAASTRELDDLRERMQSLEDTVQRQSAELEHLADAQRFTNRLLSDREHKA